MENNYIALAIIYFSIILVAYFSNNRYMILLPTFIIGVCLLSLDLPDLEAYKEHYEIAAKEGFTAALLSNNFEIGYVALVYMSSKLIPFWLFYICIFLIAVAIYIKFEKNIKNIQTYIFVCLLLSACLYFFSFTIRTTIASIFLAYALIKFKEEKNTAGIFGLLCGVSFHMVIAPFLILPIMIRFKSIINNHYLKSIVVIFFISFVFTDLTLLSSIGGVSEFIETKFTLYKDDTSLVSGLFLSLWILVFVGSVVFPKLFDDFDRVLLLSVLSILIVLSPYPFFQGRFMWLTSFIFAYFLTQFFQSKFLSNKSVRFILTSTLSLVVFFRF